MTTRRVSFREVRDRFTHIDATFVSASATFGPATARYTVCFYPWWEHPGLVDVRGGQWRIAAPEEAAREVTVVARDPIAIQLSERGSVTDWSFSEDHPLLWPYEDQLQIMCNGDFDRRRLIQAVMARKMPGVTRTVLSRYLDPEPTHHAPFALGYFPATLYLALREELTRMGVPILASREPTPRDRPILFLIDGEDYIVARDFEVEVPDFEHRPEWCTVTAAGR